MSASIPLLLALVFLIMSFVWAVWRREMSALLLAVWAIACIAILPGVV